MKKSLTILAIILTAGGLISAHQQTRAPQKSIAHNSTLTEKAEWENLRARFTQYAPNMSGLVWTLIHAYSSKSEMERALDLMKSMALTLASDAPSSVSKFNGPLGFKQKLVKLMSSDDETVSGFAASMLGIIGDQDYAPQIASLLDRSSNSERMATVRGRAAAALGFMGARQYAPRIALLLKSENLYDRRGAAWALGLLKATEYANDLVDGLVIEYMGASDDDSPIYALFEMGMAGNYKKEIARILDSAILGDRAVTACYALASLGAKEHTPDIAELLKDDFKKRDAAKALAILGAKEYVAEIQLLLDDKNSFNREAGALALGILDAREHALAVFKLLKDKTGWVQRAAAMALVFMEANEYARKSLAIIGRQQQGPYFDAGDFNTLVTKETQEIDKRFRVLLARVKAQHPTSRSLNSKPRLRHTNRR